MTVCGVLVRMRLFGDDGLRDSVLRAQVGRQCLLDKVVGFEIFLSPSVTANMFRYVVADIRWYGSPLYLRSTGNACTIERRRRRVDDIEIDRGQIRFLSNASHGIRDGWSAGCYGPCRL